MACLFFYLQFFLSGFDKAYKIGNYTKVNICLFDETKNPSYPPVKLNIVFFGEKKNGETLTSIRTKLSKQLRQLNKPATSA